ncbi:uncharacterized protein LOC144766934 [Lissotriton helveticus]
MRALLICVLAAAFFVQGSYSALQCYECITPPLCLKKKMVTCQEGEVCQRAQRLAAMPSDKPEPGDEFGTIGGAIMHRKCNKEAACQNETKNKLSVVSCCKTNLCNN